MLFIVNIIHVNSVYPILRRLLTFCGISLWKHFYSGLCRSEYAGIDLYMKTLTPLMLSTVGERAHYVLNVSRPWYLREVYGQEDWWLCRDWKFNGQLDPYFDAGIVDPGLRDLTMAIVDNPSAGMGP